MKGRSEVKVENQGAEYGILAWKDGDRDFKLGDSVELYPSNLDMSTNVYAAITSHAASRSWMCGQLWAGPALLSVDDPLSGRLFRVRPMPEHDAAIFSGETPIVDLDFSVDDYIRHSRRK